MKHFKPSVKDAMITIDHVEETSEGLLKGGFAIIGGDNPISPQGINIIACKENSGNCVAGCGGPTSKTRIMSINPNSSLSF